MFTPVDTELLCIFFLRCLSLGIREDQWRLPQLDWDYTSPSRAYLSPLPLALLPDFTTARVKDDENENQQDVTNSTTS